MPASKLEIHEAEEEGIEIVELVAPVRFIAGKSGKVAQVECQRMKLGIFDDSARRKSAPIKESTFFIEVDTVIPAISQYADLPFIPKENIGLTPWGTFDINKDTMMTSMKGVFAGGDVVRGPDTVIRAIADGKQAAISIDIYLGGKGILNKGVEISIPDVCDEDEIVALNRYSLDMLDVEKRVDNFDEVVLGYHKLTAVAESMRCLHCERR